MTLAALVRDLRSSLSLQAACYSTALAWQRPSFFSLLLGAASTVALQLLSSMSFGTQFPGSWYSNFIFHFGVAETTMMILVFAPVAAWRIGLIGLSGASWLNFRGPAWCNLTSYLMKTFDLGCYLRSSWVQIGFQFCVLPSLAYSAS